MVTDTAREHLVEFADPDAAIALAEGIASGARDWPRNRPMDRGLLLDPARRHEELIAAIARKIPPESVAETLDGLRTATKWITVAGEPMEVPDSAIRATFVKLYGDQFVGTPQARTPVEGEKTQTLDLETLLGSAQVRALLKAKIEAMDAAENSSISTES